MSAIDKDKLKTYISKTYLSEVEWILWAQQYSDEKSFDEIFYDLEVDMMLLIYEIPAAAAWCVNSPEEFFLKIWEIVLELQTEIHDKFSKLKP